MNDEDLLKEVMQDLELQTELGHDKNKLKQRRDAVKKEKEHKDELKRKRQRKPKYVAETEEERKLRRYGLEDSGLLDP